MFVRVQLAMALKPDGVVVDPVNWLQHLSSLYQRQQQSMTTPHPSQQLRAIQNQLMLMQGLPAVMPTNISQSG